MKTSTFYTDLHRPVAAAKAALILQFEWLRSAWRRVGLVFFLTSYLAIQHVYALQGANGAHDPSTIVKSGNTYWIFTTGDGIYGMYSTDLVSWTPGPRPVFAIGTWPSWINAKVPGFAGNFWAPECKFMNGKYYLYYSCSTFGSRVSTIGLATNVTLDPASPNYKWEDQGEVVSTNASSAVNAIDPALFEDADGKLWLTYGSFFGGIRATQLDKITGKPLDLATQYALANGGVEASYIIRNGSYYYLFINRGACCQGVNSTYNVQVGRSTSPTGPYLDKNGVSLNSNGGTSVLVTSGHYIGPGQVGFYQENGVTYVSHHYYEGFENGAPKLSLANLQWDAGQWPVLTRDWVGAGRYEITSRNSGKVWDAWGCTGVAGQAIAQGNKAGLTCQQWDFTSVGNGEYKITSALGGLAAEVANCSPYLAAKLQLNTYGGLLCQQFKIERANDGSYVFASVNGNRVVEVPGASQTAGVQLGLWDYNGCTCQRWTLGNAIVTATTAQKLPELAIYPSPVTQGKFTVDLGDLKLTDHVRVEVLNVQGQLVYQQQFSPKPQLEVSIDKPLSAGMYLVRLSSSSGLLTKKIVVQ
jgi:arabinan endo-1,5-alpha-L-arabinosidase